MNRTPVAIVALSLCMVACAGPTTPPPGNAHGPAPLASSGTSANTAERPAASAASGSAGPTSASAASSDTVVATVNGEPITMAQLMPPLIESYGLSFLVRLATLELAKQEAHKHGYTVNDADIAAERVRMLEVLKRETREQQGSGPATEPSDDITESQYEQLLQQVLDEKHMTQAEFHIAMETNAYLRKIATPQIEGHFTEDQILETFNATYGEKIRIRHIMCNNDQEVAQVRAELAAGKDFAAVAMERSRNSLTGPMGGELPPFARTDPGFPDDFKALAFGLKVGEVSSTIEVGTTRQIIKLEERIPPKVVKFKDYRDSVARQMYDDAIQKAMKDFNDQLGRQVAIALKVRDPVLKKQLDAEFARQTEVITKEKLARQWEQEHQAATRPSAATGAAPAFSLPPPGEPEAGLPTGAPATRPATIQAP